MSYCAGFMMRVRGKKADCDLFLSQLNAFNMETDEKRGNDDDTMIYLHGRCESSVQDSMVARAEKPLSVWANDHSLEIEVFGYDEEEPVGVQHYHYKGPQCIKAFALPSYFELDEEYRDSFIENSEDAQYYDWDEENECFELKPEFEEHWHWNDDEYRMEVDFTMSFDDLKQ